MNKENEVVNRALARLVFRRGGRNILARARESFCADSGHFRWTSTPRTHIHRMSWNVFASEYSLEDTYSGTWPAPLALRSRERGRNVPLHIYSRRARRTRGSF